MEWRVAICYVFLYAVGIQQTSGTNHPNGSAGVRLAHSVSDFGYRLSLKLLEQHPNENIVTSPTAVAGLLAMTLLGSVGDTYDELVDALGFSHDRKANRENHQQLGNVLRLLGGDDTTPAPAPRSDTRLASAVFVADGVWLRGLYQDYLRRVYAGEALTADFGKEDTAKDMINAWVESKTKGKINEFLDRPLPQETKVVLLSALYFLGQWKMPFTQNYTRNPAKFDTPDGKSEVNYMLNFGDFQYGSSHKHGIHMVALPYNDSETIMYVLKPEKPKQLNLKTVLNRLTYDEIDDIINDALQFQDTIIKFPKMKASSKINLVSSLKELGVKTLFTPRANLAVMFDSEVTNKSQEESKESTEKPETLPNPGVFVDTVLHETKIDINEYGTEAVAVAAGWLARSAAMFYADSPFYLFIRNEKTKLVTFSAIINDPTL